MHLSVKSRPIFLLLLPALLLISIVFFAAACGGEKASTDTTGSVITGLTGAGDSTATSGQASSTTTSAMVTTSSVTASTSSSSTTTTAAPTTTTAKSTTTTVKATSTTAKPTTTTGGGAVALTLLGPAGTKQLSMADLKALPATSGYGGWKNKTGNITAPVSWKGVSIVSLIELAGGGSSVKVTASDGYVQPLSAGELGGGVTMYDPATGEAIASISGSLRVILAYSKDGSSLGGDEGPLRIAFVSPEKDQVTDGSNWVRMVVKIEVQ
jgi:hypothetical protein